MTSILTINKLIITFLAMMALVFIFAGLAHAETATNSSVSASDATSSEETVAKSHGITFPIAELGNCASITECRAFCSLSTSSSVCMEFGKKHGLKPKVNESEILSAAVTELGCSSKEACQTFCGLQENWIKCGEFAKKHGLGGPSQTNVAEADKKAEFLAKAKEVLGCDSMDSCKAFCSQTDNRQKCEDFAKQMGIGGGKHLPPGQLNVKPGTATHSGMGRPGGKMGTPSATGMHSRPIEPTAGNSGQTTFPGVRGVSTSPNFLQQILHKLGL